MLVNVSLEMGDLVDAVYAGLSREDTLAFVKDLDLTIGDVDFTEKLIRLLVESLLEEFTNTEGGSKVRDSAQAKLDKLFRVIHKGLEL